MNQTTHKPRGRTKTSTKLEKQVRLTLEPHYWEVLQSFPSYSQAIVSLIEKSQK
jgi:hypothetical protein